VFKTTRFYDVLLRSSQEIWSLCCRYALEE